MVDFNQKLIELRLKRAAAQPKSADTASEKGNTSGRCCCGRLVSGPFFVALKRHDQRWLWGGDTIEDAVNEAIQLWGGENRPDGFFVAPSHSATADEKADHGEEYTIHLNEAEWIPLR